MTRHEHEPFGGLRPSRPPDALERRVLDAAGRALAEEVTPTAWDRLWNSRPLRLAWLVTTGALLVAHVALSLPRGETPRPKVIAGSASDTRPDDLREIFRLPQVEISHQAARRCLGPAASERNKKDKTKTEKTS